MTPEEFARRVMDDIAKAEEGRPLSLEEIGTIMFRHVPDAARSTNGGLDMERLFRVLWETDHYYRFANDKQPDVEQRFRDWAAHIAREYAALGSEDEG